MNTRHGRAAMRARGAAVILALAGGCRSLGPDAGPAPMPWIEDRPARRWELKNGSTFDAAYDSYHNGVATLFAADDGRRLDVNVNDFIERDRALIHELLRQPHGEIDKVTFVAWRDNRPVFRLAVTYSPRGTVTESPLLNLYYLVEEAAGERFVKHACERIQVYPSKGKLALDGFPPSPRIEVAGAQEPAPERLRIMAHRAVMVLPLDRGRFQMLDAFIEQNDQTLRSAGAPTNWWTPAFPSGPVPANKPSQGMMPGP